MTASDPKLAEPDHSGQTLDRYHLLRRIGVGGMGAVYEAEHTRLRKRFAVKLLRQDLARDETFRKRFLREARAASAITHPNVVAISDFGETDDDQVFFVMEMLAGRDLQELLDAAGRLPWPRTRDILLQVTSALQAAHAQAIIHRDIKPSNVFLADVAGKDGEDYVKVLDFGIAKLSGSLGEATVKLTSTDEIFGTVAYMAPEMALGINDDLRSDVYAVGVMMYRMLTGGLPFTQGTAFQILSQHLNAPLPPPRGKEPSIPEPVEAILLRALAKSPDERFASMDDFGRALRRGTLEVTEWLTAQHTQVLAGTPKLHEDSPGSAVDKTTPLPASGYVPGPAPLATAVPPSAAAPRTDVLGAPLEVAPTIASSPITVASFDSAPLSPVPRTPPGTVTTDGSGPMGVPGHASGPMLAPASVQAPAGLDSGSTRIPPPARGSLVSRIVLLVLGVAALAAVITLVVLRDPEPADDASPTQTAAVVEPKEGKPKPEPVAPTKAEPEPVAPTKAEPTEPVPPTEPEPIEPEPTDDPADPPVAEPKPTGHAGTKAKPKPKPKTDAEVVAALKAKLASKCKADGTTKVRVEGMITGAGTTTGLLITPPTGPGACATGIVSKARFDPAAGSRPIPRFAVEL